ncbi:hypothetical protein [Mucilaginibacter sp. KACC 22063]|uniref:hypothetical protein n=1 Tax=Mucilaginibacter sp. KACC 22063 TaxID=3025666 RepID=UPI0023655CDB|nr:hypothetical protein [Mucilaginibacter sp. KACC 22063]WDF54116.1 hypothetical protein PQ461_14315 [Mucilaginibacter sp. KACC 22063]
MRISTIVAIVIAILLTVVFMQNTDEVRFTLLFTSMYVSKVVMMGIVAVIAFILGVIIGRPKRRAKVEDFKYDEDDKEHLSKPGGLTDEDREYIN